MKEEIINGIKYRLDEDALTAEVIQDHDNDYDGDIVIPEKVESEKLPYCVTSIGEYAFYDCESLSTIQYAGTIAQWKEIEFGDGWNDEIPAKVVHCTDGDVKM